MYYFSMFSILTIFTVKIEALIRLFFWSIKENRRKLYNVKWALVVLKKLRCLIVGSISNKNKALNFQMVMEFMIFRFHIMEVCY